MPKLTKSALDERRNHILRAAELCFAKSGFRGTTIADVKREASVSTGAIYTYFPNKEAMMRALLETKRDERTKQLERATEGGAGGQALLLLQWAAAVFGPQGQHLARVDVNLWSEALRSARIGELARAELQKTTETLSRVVAAQQHERGLTDAFETNAAASLLLAIYLGFEVQTAVGMKLDLVQVAKVLATTFADFLPSGEPTASSVEPARRKRVAQGKRAPRTASR